MKIIPFLISVSICCCTFSCQDEFAGGCEEMSEGLLSLDVEKVSVHVNYLLGDSLPSPVSGDQIGHEENLDAFIERMHSYCSLQAEKGCYACIETYPPLSHVIVRLDSAGTTVARTLDIVTPSDTLMTLRAIHF